MFHLEPTPNSLKIIKPHMFVFQLSSSQILIRNWQSISGLEEVLTLSPNYLKKKSILFIQTQGCGWLKINSK